MLGEILSGLAIDAALSCMRPIKPEAVPAILGNIDITLATPSGRRNPLPNVTMVIGIIISSGLLIVFQAKMSIMSPPAVKIIVPDSSVLSMVMIFITFLLNTLPSTYAKDHCH